MRLIRNIAFVGLIVVWAAVPTGANVCRDCTESIVGTDDNPEGAVINCVALASASFYGWGGCHYNCDNSTHACTDDYNGTYFGCIGASEGPPDSFSSYGTCVCNIGGGGRH